MNKIYEFEILSEGVVDEIKFIGEVKSDHMKKLEFKGILQEGLNSRIPKEKKIANVVEFKIPEPWKLYLSFEQDIELQPNKVYGLYIGY